MAFLEYLGSCFLAACVSVLVGELSISFAYRINRAHLKNLNQEVKRYERLVAEASDLADPEVYRAVNREGNEAFGRLFFYKTALSAASLWPVFFALEWLQDRYGSKDVLIPWTPWQANYVVTLFICYVLARILFGRVKRHIPYFRAIRRILEEDQLDAS